MPRCALAVFAVGRLSVANEMACGCERGPGEREEEKEGVAPSSSVVIETTRSIIMSKLSGNETRSYWRPSAVFAFGLDIEVLNQHNLVCGFIIHSTLPVITLCACSVSLYDFWRQLGRPRQDPGSSGTTTLLFYTQKEHDRCTRRPHGRNVD